MSCSVGGSRNRSEVALLQSTYCAEIAGLYIARRKLDRRLSGSQQVSCQACANTTAWHWRGQVRHKLEQDVAASREAAEAIRRDREELTERMKTVKQQEETIGEYRVSPLGPHPASCMYSIQHLNTAVLWRFRDIQTLFRMLAFIFLPSHSEAITFIQMS